MSEPLANNSKSLKKGPYYFDSPMQIPWQGWKQILKRTYLETSRDNVSMLAAGVSFFAMISLIPLIIAAMSIYGIVGNPEFLASQILGLEVGLPTSARSFLADQLNKLAQTPSESLGWSAALSIAIALYSASKAVRGLVDALNIVYDETESRSIVRQFGLSMLLTFSGIILLFVMIGAIVVIPTVTDLVGMSFMGEMLTEIIKWTVVAGTALFALAVLDRYAPNRNEAKWRWVSFGAGITTIGWLAASFGFQYYVDNFSDYNEVYGSLAGVIVLLLWFYISSYVILLGAELNSEIEYQSLPDTTRGPPQPMGQRGAVKADTHPTGPRTPQQAYSRSE